MIGSESSKLLGDHLIVSGENQSRTVYAPHLPYTPCRSALTAKNGDYIATTGVDVACLLVYIETCVLMIMASFRFH